MNKAAIISPDNLVNESYLLSVGFIFHHNEGYGKVYHNHLDTYIINTEGDHFFIMKDFSKMVYSGDVKTQAKMNYILLLKGIITCQDLKKVS